MGDLNTHEQEPHVDTRGFLYTDGLIPPSFHGQQHAHVSPPPSNPAYFPHCFICPENIASGTLDGKQLQRIAGNGLIGYSGDGGPATKATFNWPHEVRSDAMGHLYIADTRNHVIRKVDADTGVVTTLAGNGSPGFAGDGKRGTEIQFKQPHSVVLDGETKTIHHVAGSGIKGYTGDGGPPRLATFKGPKGLVLDHQGRILVVDTENHAVRRIDLSLNRVDTVLGGTTSDDTFPLKRPHGIAYKNGFGYLVADSEFHRVLLGQ